MDPIHEVTSQLRYQNESRTYNDIVAWWRLPPATPPRHHAAATPPRRRQHSATFTDHNVSSAGKLNVKVRYLPLTE